MYLSGLVERQRVCVVPVMVTLVISWCLLLCASLAHAESHDTASPDAPVAEQRAVPPCHSQSNAEQEAAPDSLMAHQNLIEDCEACNAQPDQAGSGSAPQAIMLLVDWFGSLLSPLGSQSVAVGPSPNPPPPPSDRLHLIKGVFLI